MSADYRVKKGLKAHLEEHIVHEAEVLKRDQLGDLISAIYDVTGSFPLSIPGTWSEEHKRWEITNAVEDEDDIKLTFFLLPDRTLRAFHPALGSCDPKTAAELLEWLEAKTTEGK